MRSMGEKVGHSRVVKRFYEELENGKFLATKCPRCGHVEFPPVYVCNECGCMDMEWYEITGNAKLIRFVVNGPLSPREAEPYSLGVVELEEGTQIQAMVFGVSKKNADEINAKLPVPLKVEALQRDGYKTIAFRLVEE
jgi:uncharacterized OB-fold protein